MRFSPKARRPAWYASRMPSHEKVLEMATIAISSVRRPARAVALAIRSRTRSIFAAIELVLAMPGAILARSYEALVTRSMTLLNWTALQCLPVENLCSRKKWRFQENHREPG